MTEVGGRLPETAAVLAVRRGVRAWVAARGGRRNVVVGLSGGADSLALAAAAVVECGPVTAVVVDHGLQEGSGEVAARAVEQALALGCVAASVVRVEVGRDGGVEAAARAARYAALESVRDGRPVLLGHTLDDQAETVLLGLARGSGGRSIQGMAAWNDPWGRPLLGVRRADTVQMCADLGIEPWQDPHNTDPAYTRVRLRTEVLPLLEDVLGGGVAQALARTADQLRDDNTALDTLATDLLSTARRPRPPSTDPADPLPGARVPEPPNVGSADQLPAARAPKPPNTGSADQLPAACAPKPPNTGSADQLPAARAPEPPNVGSADQLPAARASERPDTEPGGSGVDDSDQAGLAVEILATVPAAVRRRVVRAWLAEQGITGVLNAHLRAIDELVTSWRGQGGVAVGGGDRAHRLVVTREHGTLTVRAQPRTVAT